MLLESLAVLYITATFSEEMVFPAGSFTLQKVRVQGPRGSPLSAVPPRSSRYYMLWCRIKMQRFA